jgi:hypothetical protein
MATQIADTPTLYGRDAQSVLKQIESKPSKRDVDKLKSSLNSKFQGIETGRR